MTLIEYLNVNESILLFILPGQNLKPVEGRRGSDLIIISLLLLLNSSTSSESISP